MLDPLEDHLSVLDSLFDPNRVVTKFENPSLLLPKRYIFSRIEGTSDLILRIDNSSLEVFVTCPRSAQYKLIVGKEAPGSAAMEFGSRIHECLEYTYQNKFDEPTYRYCLKLLNARFTSNPFPEDEWRTQELAVKVLSQYFNKYQLDLETYSPVSVEKAFSLPLCTIRLGTHLPVSCHELLGEKDNHDLVYVDRVHVYWSGKMDLAMATRTAGMVSVWDHKTTSMLGEQFFADFYLSQQTVGYVWASKKLLDLPYVPGFLVNGIGVRKPTRTGVSVDLQREPFLYSEFHLSEWERDMQQLVSDFLSHLRSGYFPKATKWCFGKYSKCQYHPVCRRDTERERHDTLHNLPYHDVSWTPFIRPPVIDVDSTPSAPLTLPTVVNKFLGQPIPVPRPSPSTIYLKTQFKSYYINHARLSQLCPQRRDRNRFYGRVCDGQDNPCP
jgi:hypothetical protein